MGTNKLLDTALFYAKTYGWAVFPTRPSKKPYTPHGCKDAKTDPGAIRAWWAKWPNAGIGIATGSASNLIVIDEDIDDDKGINGFDEVSKWESLNGNLPETVTAITGRGGYHLYFHYEGKDIGNRAGLLDGVDVRGEGGYVIAPPSTHPNGTEYAWEFNPQETAIAPLTDAVKQLIGYHEATAEAFQAPATIESGKRNDTLYKMACSLQAKGFPDQAIIEAVMQTNNTLCVEPLERAEIEAICKSAFGHEKGKLRIIEENNLEWHHPKMDMVLDKNGDPTDKVAQSIKNAEEAIQFDKDLFGRIVYNELSHSIYAYGNLPWRICKGWREWDNNDDSNLWSYIENRYGIKPMDRIMSALSNVAHRIIVNPVIEMLKQAHQDWDGQYGHIAALLPKYTGAEPSEYNTEVLKLFMLGAVSRIHKPGCKFDYMLVLVGEQGKFKSSFLRFLATNDDWFNDNFNSLDGDRAMERLQGMWIVELAELQATKRAKDVETIKGFITSRDDTFRAPYARRKEHHKRMCVLAGTSNPVDFLTDKTGNRRFLPITCGVTEPINPFDDIETTVADFHQAWGEIMDIYMRAGGKVTLALNRKFEADALKAQQKYTEEDPDVGVIQAWLDATDHKRVCVSMIWDEALKMSHTKPELREVNRIHEIMKNNIEGWKPIGRQRIDGQYGIQRAYERINDKEVDEIPFD